jgi:hypothetical protein
MNKSQRPIFLLAVLFIVLFTLPIYAVVTNSNRSPKVVDHVTASVIRQPSLDAGKLYFREVCIDGVTYFATQTTNGYWIISGAKMQVISSLQSTVITCK